MGLGIAALLINLERFEGGKEKGLRSFTKLEEEGMVTTGCHFEKIWRGE